MEVWLTIVSIDQITTTQQIHDIRTALQLKLLKLKFAAVLQSNLSCRAWEMATRHAARHSSSRAATHHNAEAVPVEYEQSFKLSACHACDECVVRVMKQNVQTWLNVLIITSIDMIIDQTSNFPSSNLFKYGCNKK